MEIQPLAVRPHTRPGADGHLQVAGQHIRFLWLVPITNSEADLVKAEGNEALEQLLERDQADVIDPNRPALA
jgi:hypothetical protein